MWIIERSYEVNFIGNSAGLAVVTNGSCVYIIFVWFSKKCTG